MERLHIFRRFILIILTATLLYFTSSLLLLILHPHSAKADLQKHSRHTDTVYIYHDLAHTEIIIPSRALISALKEKLKPFVPAIDHGYIAFSFADEDFLFQTPQWKDIHLIPTLKALFTNTPAVIRVGHYTAIRNDESVIPLHIDTETEQILQKEILHTFATDKQYRFIPRTPPHPNTYQYYFRAKHPYNLFYTCNTWSGEMLRRSGFPVSLWTPLAFEVVFHFPK